MNLVVVAGPSLVNSYFSPLTTTKQTIPSLFSRLQEGACRRFFLSIPALFLSSGLFPLIFFITNRLWESGSARAAGAGFLPFNRLLFTPSFLSQRVTRSSCPLTQGLPTQVPVACLLSLAPPPLETSPPSIRDRSTSPSSSTGFPATFLRNQTRPFPLSRFNSTRLDLLSVPRPRRPRFRHEPSSRKRSSPR